MIQVRLRTNKNHGQYAQYYVWTHFCSFMFCHHWFGNLKYAQFFFGDQLANAL